MKLIPALILCACLVGCAYNGPKIALQVGFLGSNVGVTVGSDPPVPEIIRLPAPSK